MLATLAKMWTSSSTVPTTSAKGRIINISAAKGDEPWHLGMNIQDSSRVGQHDVMFLLFLLAEVTLWSHPTICLFQEAMSRGIAKAASEPIALLDEKNVQKIPQVSRHVAKPTNKHANCEEKHENSQLLHLVFPPCRKFGSTMQFLHILNIFEYMNVCFCLICSNLGASSWALPRDLAHDSSKGSTLFNAAHLGSMDTDTSYIPCLSAGLTFPDVQILLEKKCWEQWKRDNQIGWV